MKKCKALAVVKEEAAKADKRNNSHFVFVDNSGNVYEKFNKICLAELRCPGGISALRFFINQHDGVQVAPENHSFVKEHIEQLVRKSPISSAIRNKKVFWDNGLNMDCSLSLRHLFFAMTLVRMSYEFDERGYNKAVKLLMEVGIPRFDAAIIAQHMYWGTKNKAWQVYNRAGGHGVSNNDFTFEGLKKLSEDVSCAFTDCPPANKGGGFFGLFDSLDTLARKQKEMTMFNSILAIGKKNIGEGWNATNSVTEEQMIENIKTIKERFYA